METVNDERRLALGDTSVALARPERHEAPRWAGPLAVATVGLLLLWRLWEHTGQLLLDFGRELYVSWQVSLGKVLYRDLDYHFGPLGIYANAFWMAHFGSGLNTIRASNALVLLGVCVLLYRILLRLSNRLAACVAMIVFLTVFALSLGARNADCNFLTPYNHGVIYGTLLWLAAISVVPRFCERGRYSDAALAGLITGLCFLTKPEFFLACFAGVFPGLIAGAWVMRYSIPKTLLAFLAALAIPPTIATLLLWRAMPLGAAVGGTLGGWQFMFDKQITNDPFYRYCFGTNETAENVRKMFESAGGYAAFAALLLAAARAGARPRVARMLSALIGALMVFLVLGLHAFHRYLWDRMDRGLPILMIGASMLAALELIGLRRRTPATADVDDKSLDDKISRRAVGTRVLWFAFVVLATMLLAKMFLHVRANFYGFALAMPAGMAAVLLLLDALPRRAARLGCNPLVVQMIVLAFLASVVARRVVLTEQLLDERDTTTRLALGGKIDLNPYDSLAAGEIDKVVRHLPADATLATFPDSSGFNYAIAHASSVPYTVFNPFELKLSGMESVFSALRKSPPQYVMMIDTDMGIFGPRTFGRDYARELGSWIEENYQPVPELSSPEPSNPDVRRIVILRRREP